MIKSTGDDNIIKAILIDGNKSELDELYKIITRYEFIDVIGMYTESDTAFEEIIINKPDIVFLETYLPDTNGLWLARKIYKIDNCIDIVIVSGDDTYGVEAFQINVVDYVLKPLTQQRIDLTIDKIKKRRMLA